MVTATSRKFLSLLIAAVLLASCGYYNPYTVSLKETGKVSVYLPMWKNRTNELGLEATLHQALHDWFAESRYIHIAESAEEADYLLNGVILSIDVPGLSYGSFDQATELRAELKVQYSMNSGKNGTLIIPVREITKRESFATGADAPHSRTNKEVALAKIVDQLGEEIYISATSALTRQRISK